MLSSHGACNARSAKLRSNVFTLPRTPMASSPSESMHLTTSGSGEYHEDSSQSITRKRTRHDFYEISLSSSDSIAWNNTADSTKAAESDPCSPLPFVNTRYALAGGLDTPGVVEAALHERANSQYGDNAYRRNLGWYAGSYAEESSSFFPHMAHHTALESQAVNASTACARGWSKAALDVVGDMVGKVWNFCTVGAFRGFAAGGGTQYNERSRPLVAQGSKLVPVHSSCGQEDIEWSTASLPGRFPGDAGVSSYTDPSALRDDSPQRPAKRRQVSNNKGGDLLTNRVVVDHATEHSTSSSGTVCSKSRTSQLCNQPGSPSPGRKSGPSAASRPALRAGTKRPSSINSRASISHSGSPALNLLRPASFAPPRSPTSRRVFEPSASPKRATNTHSGQSSPAAVEAKKWAWKQKQQERETDLSMRRLNKQLQDMIKEGKAALGSKIEMDAEDMGFEEGEYDNDTWKI